MAGVISYPTGLDYQQALYNTRLAFQDPALRGGEPVLDPLGMPKAIGGNFASVFTVNGTDGQRWAVKCFTRSVPDLSLRYRQVSKALDGVKSPWKVGFQYLQDGVLSHGTWYPVLKMEWVEARSLLPYVEDHLTDQETLADLAGKFGDLVRDLSRHGIAHGDLQHGNILVTPSGELKLIDYDGMFVPGLDGLGASELGHANYQSPLRTRDNWGPDIDRFSSWVIYTSLTALALDPVLWQTLHVDGDETLLFHKNDFTDRGASRVRYALANSSAARLRQIARDIDFLWAPDLAAVPALETLLYPTGTQALRGTATGSQRTVNLRPAAGTDWLRQHQATSGMPVTSASAARATGDTGVTGQARPIGASAWLTTHVAVDPHLEFSPPKARIRISFAVLLGFTVLCTALPGLRFLDPLLVLTIWAVTFVAYRSSPQGRDRRRSHMVFSERRSAAAQAGRTVSALERATRKVVREAEGEHSAAERKAEQAREDEQREIDDVSDRLDREIQRLNDRISALQGAEDMELATALTLLQRAHIDDRLRATPVMTSRIRGIGPSVAARLAAHGIVTAADIAAVRGAVIVRPDGVPVSPRGIGQRRAAKLYSWRLQVEFRAQLTMPTELPRMVRQGIARRYAWQKDSLKADQVASRGRAALAQTDLRNKWAVTHSGIARELRQARERLEKLRASQAPDIVAARKQSETANWQRDFAMLELNRYRRISYSRYLRRLLAG
jgi:hypothetical protein